MCRHEHMASSGAGAKPAGCRCCLLTALVLPAHRGHQHPDHSFLLIPSAAVSGCATKSGLPIFLCFPCLDHPHTQVLLQGCFLSYLSPLGHPVHLATASLQLDAHGPPPAVGAFSQIPAVQHLLNTLPSASRTPGSTVSIGVGEPIELTVPWARRHLS